MFHCNKYVEAMSKIHFMDSHNRKYLSSCTNIIVPAGEQVTDSIEASVLDTRWCCDGINGWVERNGKLYICVIRLS